MASAVEPVPNLFRHHSLVRFVFMAAEEKNIFVGQATNNGRKGGRKRLG